jgi:hypothetical protein
MGGFSITTAGEVHKTATIHDDHEAAATSSNANSRHLSILAPTTIARALTTTARQHRICRPEDI